MIDSKYSGQFTVSLVKTETGEKAVLKSAGKAFIKSHAELLRSFSHEKAALIALSYPGIVKLYNTYQDAEKIYILEELAEGVSVSTLLRVYQTLPDDLIKIIAVQMVALLDYLQANNYAHRDIKASHIFLDEDLNLRLIDFGFAKKIEGKSNSFCGTFHAMAPEILAIVNGGGPGYTSSVDLYAFGILLYEMKMGSPPGGYIQEEEEKKDTSKLYEKANKGWDQEIDKIEGDMKTLLKGLLEPKEEKRMTIEQIKSHPYFKGVDWKNIKEKDLSKLDEFTSYIGNNNYKNRFGWKEKRIF